MWFAVFAAIAAATALAAGVQQYQASRAVARQQKQAGLAQQQAAEYSATLAGRRAEALEERAGQERATAQRRAIEERRQGRFIESRARALAAAGGGSVSDPTVVGILGDIETEAEYRALTGLFEGEELARGLEYGAVLERAGGEGERFAGQVEANLARQRARTTRTQGIGSLIGGVGQAAGIGASAFASAGGGGSGGGKLIGGSGSDTLYTKYAAPYKGRI